MFVTGLSQCFKGLLMSPARQMVIFYAKHRWQHRFRHWHFHSMSVSTLHGGMSALCFQRVIKKHDPISAGFSWGFVMQAWVMRMSCLVQVKKVGGVTDSDSEFIAEYTSNAFGIGYYTRSGEY